MRAHLSPLLLLTAALAFGSAIAQESDDGAEAVPPNLEERRASREAMRERWQNMSDEEREALRAQRRERLQNMSEEEREALRAERRARGDGDRPPRRAQLSEEERAAMRERWEGMSDEERQAAREKMRERRGLKDEKRPSMERGTDKPEA